MSDVVVFLGPSLDADEARALLPSATILPPVEQGDVVRVVLERRCGLIGIIDGYFERVPAVWHKEILWAMDRGVHVLGGASMGALRAAELHAFGMEGVGAIFEAFRDGALDADDEVAVLHGPADVGPRGRGYRPMSEALVNVRATVGAAHVTGVIGGALRDLVVASAKSLFYPERTYPAIFDEARKRGADDAELATLEGFAQASPVDQKGLDARELLSVMASRLAAGLSPKRVDYVFQRTSYFAELERDVSRRARAAVVPSHDLLIAEVLLDPKLASRVDAVAVRLLLAARDAAERGLRFDDERALVAASDTFRRERGLEESASFAGYLAREAIDDAELRRLLVASAEARWHGETFREQIHERYGDALRLLGLHGEVSARASKKAAVLASRGLDGASLRDAGISEADLLGWYFAERLGRSTPDDVDAFARSLGFAELDAFVRAVLADYLFEGVSVATFVPEPLC